MDTREIERDRRAALRQDISNQQAKLDAVSAELAARQQERVRLIAKNDGLRDAQRQTQSKLAQKNTEVSDLATRIESLRKRERHLIALADFRIAAENFWEFAPLIVEAKALPLPSTQVVKAVQQYMAGAPQADDITCLTLRYAGHEEGGGCHSMPRRECCNSNNLI
jgi:hypothetical protein